MGLGWLPEAKDTRAAIKGIVKNIDNIWEHLNVEVKHHDVYQPLTTSVVTPTFYELSAISAGITGSSSGSIDTGYRDGDKIRMRTLQVNLRITPNASQVKSNDIYFMVVKHYDNFLGLGPIYDDIYDPHSSVYVVNRLRSNEHTGQYKILARRKVVVEQLGQDRYISNPSIYIKPKSRKNTHIEWEGTLSSDPSNGKFYLVVYCDAGSPDTPDYTFTSRLTYVDN